MKIHSAPALFLKFTQDNEHLISAAVDKRVLVYNTKNKFKVESSSWVGDENFLSGCYSDEHE